MNSKELQEGIRKYLQNAETTTIIIDKAKVLNRIDSIRQVLRHLLSIEAGLTAAQRKDIAAFITTNERTRTYANLYVKFSKGLVNKAAEHETATPFSILFLVATKMVDALTAMEQKVVKTFEEKINLATTRFSHLAIFGAMDGCDLYGRIAIFLCQGIFSEIISDDDPPPPYRGTAVANHMQDLINLSNWVMAGRGPIAFETALTELQTANNDINIITDDGVPSTAFLSTNKITRNTFGLLGLGLDNIFYAIGKMYVEWQRSRITRIEQEREWIEATIALLKLKMADTDPNDRTYVRLEKIVTKYSEQLSRIDRKLEQYYKG